jgi:hypothetical protein
MLNTGKLIIAINQYVKSISDYPVYRNVIIDRKSCPGFTFLFLSHFKPFHIEHKFTTICYELLIRIYIRFLPFISYGLSNCVCIVHSHTWPQVYRLPAILFPDCQHCNLFTELFPSIIDIWILKKKMSHSQK